MRLLFVLLIIGLAAAGGVSGKLWNLASWWILILSSVGALIGVLAYVWMGYRLERQNRRPRPLDGHRRRTAR